MVSTARGSSERKVLTMIPWERQRSGDTLSDHMYAGSSRSMSGLGKCVAGSAGIPGTCTSSSPISPKLAALLACRTGKYREKARTSAGDVKKQYPGTPSSAATSSAMLQKKSTTRTVGEALARKPRRCGMERPATS
ncbi:hypothetical protein VPH35_026346 [Triticum aestivum]